MRFVLGIVLGVALVGYFAPGAVPFADGTYEIVRDLVTTVFGIFAGSST